MFALAKYTFPGGEGGPRKWWMRGRDGDSLFAIVPSEFSTL